MPNIGGAIRAITDTYYSSAELGCHLALGWPLPENVLDLYVEYRRITNGTPPTCGYGLLGALTYFALAGIASSEKQEMRELALRGGPYTKQERDALLDYCQSDVDALGRLLPAMEPRLDLAHALLRGRYMKAVARMEHTGIPVDAEAWRTLARNWSAIKDSLIQRVDVDYGFYQGGRFSLAAFTSWLDRRGNRWPQTEKTGRPRLDDDTFGDMARVYPELKRFRELRKTLNQMSKGGIAIGADGRNRSMLSPFSTRTGRNAPGTMSFIFGRAAWLRSLIRPPEGHGLAYIDWSQQEFGIAAALSGDSMMQEAYLSGDPYLAFGKQAGVIPGDATKASHGAQRENLKQCVLATQYGMGAESLAFRIGQSPAHAKALLDAHRRTYPKYWRWSEAAVDFAMLHGGIHTVFGWTLENGMKTNARSLANFPMQANGAEMLRLACIEATEGGVRVCAPVHDAVLIEAPLEELDQRIAQTQEAMAEASRLVLDGFTLRSDVKVVRHPDRYVDERGRAMWDLIWSIIEEIEPRGEAAEPAVAVEWVETA